MAGPAAQDLYEPINLTVPTYKRAVYGRLLDRILELELPPGTRLIEADIAANFGISKTPVREAFLLLEADGLVTLAKFQGATVTPLTFNEWVELVALTDSVEQPNLARVATLLDRDTKKHLRAKATALSKARRVRDGRTYRDLLAEIHVDLFEPVGSPHLVRIIAWLSRLVRRYECAFTHRFPDTWDLELEIVQSRIDGLLAGDPTGALMAVSAGHARLIDLLKERLDDPAVARYLRAVE